MPDLLRRFIALVSRLVPGEARREFRAEWDAELSSAWARRPPGPGNAARVAARALGAMPDAWCLFRQQWSVDTLVVAAAGLYGTMDFLVSRRVREIGVRLALGARPWRVVGMILGSAARVVGAGALAGVPVAMVATRSIRALLYDTLPFDARIYAGVIVVLGAVTLAAAMVPARRAARIDPLSAIRTE